MGHIMTTPDKPSLAEYEKWMAENLGVDNLKRTRNNFQSVADKMQTDFIGSDIWQRLGNRLVD